MVISQSQVTQEKEMFLKKINKIFLLIFFLIFALKINYVYSLENKQLRPLVFNYLNNINEFESNFLQSEEGYIEEGLLYIKKDRVRIQYNEPSSIRIIISKNKGMYFNEGLEELQYFNPKKNIASTLFKFFYDKDFLIDAKFNYEKNFITVEKKILIDEEIKKIKIFFESSPILLKKIEVRGSGDLMILAIINPNFNPIIDDSFFSMADPRIVKSK